MRQPIIALYALGAILFISCKESIEKTDALSALDSLSTRTVHNMKVVETKFGRVTQSLEAPLMESYSLLPEPFEIFPKGIKVLGYTPEGAMETEITANVAIHRTKSDMERWEVYGNVVVINHLKEERLLTDTLYWDIVKQRIYTHVFVKMFSPQGLMQGYGMEADERAQNIVILNPFDSYGVMQRDTLEQAPPPVDNSVDPLP